MTTPLPLDLTAWIALAALAWVGYRLVLIWAFPFAPCRHCHGAGRHSSPHGRNFRPCRRCRGSGRQLRLGRRLWHWATTSSDHT